MRFVLLAAVSVTVPGIAGATILANWSLQQVVDRADAVTIGIVGPHQYVVENGFTLTETTIYVEQELLGKLGSQLVLTQGGGRIGDRITEVVGEPRLVAGSTVLLMTYRHRDGRRYLVGMALGHYVVHGSQLSHRIEVPLMEPGRLLRAPGYRMLGIEAVQTAIAERAK